MATQPQPFTLNVPDEAIADLRERLARTRYPDQAPGEPWAYGTDVGYLRQLVDYWRTAFDWRAEEARGSMRFLNTRCRCAASTCISCTYPERGRCRVHCCCCTA